MKLLLSATIALLIFAPAFSADLVLGPDNSFLWNQFNSFVILDSFALVTSDFGLAALKLDPVRGYFDVQSHLLLGNQALEINVSGDLATVSTSAGLVYFVDLSQLPELTLIGQADINSVVYDMVLVDSDLYLACGFDGLRHYRLGAGNDLEFVDSSLAPVHCIQVETSGSDLIVLDDYNGLLRYHPTEFAMGDVEEEILVPQRVMSVIQAGDTLVLPLVGRPLIYRATFAGAGALIDSTALFIVPDQVFAVDTFLVAIDLQSRLLELITPAGSGSILVYLSPGLQLTSAGDTYYYEGAPHVALVSGTRGLISFNLFDPANPRDVYGHPGPVLSLGFHNDRLCTGGELNALELYEVDSEITPLFDTALLSLTGVDAIADGGTMLFAHFSSIGQVQALRFSDNSITRLSSLSAPTPVGGMKYYPYPISDTESVLLLIGQTKITYLAVKTNGTLRSAYTLDVFEGIADAVVVEEYLLVSTVQRQLKTYKLFPRQALFWSEVSTDGATGVLRHMVNTGPRRNSAGGLEPGIVLGFDGNQMYEVYVPASGIPQVYRLETLPLEVTSSAVGPNELYTIGPMGVGVFDLRSFFPRLLRYGGYGGHLVAFGDSVLATSDGTAIHLYSNRDGTITFAPPDESDIVIVRTSNLRPNYPNPFNPRTRIDFMVPEAGHVEVDVFDLLGRRVRSLMEGFLPPGLHSVVWEGNDSEGRRVASGIYFYRMTMGQITESRKMVLLK